VSIPETDARVLVVDFKALNLNVQDCALAAVAVVAKMQTVIDKRMLNTALAKRFTGKASAEAKDTVDKVASQVP
jgi:hypothetical protein